MPRRRLSQRELAVLAVLAALYVLLFLFMNLNASIFLAESGHRHLENSGLAIASESIRFDIGEDLTKVCKALPKGQHYNRVLKKSYNVTDIRENLPPPSMRSEECVRAISAEKSIQNWSLIDESICRHRFLWLAGLHFSGTSLLNYLTQTVLNDTVSGHAGTGSPQDEGQYLQAEFPPDGRYGGVCKFELNDEAYYNESYPKELVTATTRSCVFASWARYWDLRLPVLAEKSPPATVQLAWREWLTPGVSASIVVVRHPLYACNARWVMKRMKNRVSMFEKEHVILSLKGWVKAHEHLRKTLPRLRQYSILQYEHFFAKENAMQLLSDLVLNFFPEADALDNHRRRLMMRGSKESPTINSALFFKWANRWDKHVMKYPEAYADIKPILEEYEDVVRAFGYSLMNVRDLNSRRFDLAFGTKIKPAL